MAKRPGQATPRTGPTRQAPAVAPARQHPTAPLVEPTAPTPVRKDAPIKVRATMIGYYDHAIRRPGDVFVIANEQAFSKRWMQRVPGETPERLTTSKPALAQEHDRILAERMPGAEETTFNRNPLE